MIFIWRTAADTSAIPTMLLSHGFARSAYHYFPAMDSPSTSTLGLTKAVEEGDMGGSGSLAMPVMLLRRLKKLHG